MEIEKILKEGIAQAFDDGLGDRTRYVGASDVAGCPRKTVLSKLEQQDFDLATMIRFGRGHMAEDFLVSGVKKQKKYKWEYQKEVCHKSKPFKAHIDFVFKGKKAMAIMEVKTVSAIPRTPYDGWIQQLHFQMGLLKDANPEKKIRGSVFGIDLNSGMTQIFKGFEYNSTIYKSLLQKASHIWDCVKNPSLTPDTEKGPLCAWCSYRPGCPAYELPEELPEMPLENELQRYLGLKEEQKQLKAELDTVTAIFKTAIANANPDCEKIKVGASVIRLSKRSRESIKSAQLKKEHPEIFSQYSTKSTYQVLVVG